MSKTKSSMSSNKDSSASSYTSSSLSSDEDEIDARDLKPIRDYLSDRKELSRQLFKSVKPEKIRLMLPQVLKQMDLSELEEWCESELNGMSKARVLSILNGNPMLESSDTSELSDSSGPSLEIISDTEEWLTDDDTSKKETSGKAKSKKDKTKIKGKAQIAKKNNLNKPNIKTTCNIKIENNDEIEDVKIKKEGDKGKEGDSLLDLLELEMRARAIRALIRKEEDIIPSNSSDKNDSRVTENDVGTSQDDKEKENCRKQLERIISSQQSIKGEDEDVILVIPNPAPIVELLSSDSDREGTRVNQELQNDRASKAGKSGNNLDESSTSSHDLKERKETDEIIEIRNNATTATKTHLTNTSDAIMPERNVDMKNNILSISISANNVANNAERRKKSKKKSRGKLQLASTVTNSSESKQINITEIDEESSDKNIKVKSKMNLDEKEIVEDENETKQKIAEESKVEEERSTDLDDIDLDDYCEVMDIDNSDEDKSDQDRITVSSQQEHEQSVSETLSQPESAETWASRYYQSDDVQNVIKESKIQSEIRKRLRERQRLSKLNKSPNLNLSAQPSTTNATVTFEKTPTGSVEEYLALKRALNTDVSNISNTTVEVQCTNIDNNTTQSNHAIINSNNDTEVKEILEQDTKNISSHEECEDNNTQKVISEADIAKPTEIVIDTNNDTQSN